jgi:hypothetical protein
MHVNGSCHCGRICYEADVDPALVSACHCTDCQVLSGSAYRVSVRAPAARFKLTSGTPKTYVKTADSGNRRVHAFCADCGAPVYACALADPPFYSLRVGGLQQRAQLPPRQQIWCRSAVPWSANLGGVAQQERQ